MRAPARRSSAKSTDHDSDVTSALEALSAEELRSFVTDTLAALGRDARAQVEDALLRRASQSARGFRPKAPEKTLVAEVEQFVRAAKRVGQADPADVDDYLRQGVKASLAGDPEAARAIFGALFEPLAEVEIDLGQDEMYSDVLLADLHECAAHYAAAVYLTTPADGRAEAVLDVLDALEGITSLDEPIADMERAVGPLPELAGFLPLWIARLEREKAPAGGWESERDRWLREAVTRTEGVAGLERLARTSKVPSAVEAWCDAVVATGDWRNALKAYEDAAGLVESPPWRGGFLDGAALATQVLGRADVTKRLEAAWLGAPSLLRLLRFLAAGDPPAATLKKRAGAVLKASPTRSARLLGVLHLVAGDVRASAKLLEKAPGLGWSSADHPGHVLFATFAWLLGGAPSGTAREHVTGSIHRPPTHELAFEADMLGLGALGPPEKPGEPRLPAPTLVQVLLRAGVHEKLGAADRAALLAAMKAAATARVAGVLGEKRRRHYGHAALLVACCAELEGEAPKAPESSAWVGGIRQAWSRFPAFQEELGAALGRVSG